MAQIGAINWVSINQKLSMNKERNSEFNIDNFFTSKLNEGTNESDAFKDSFARQIFYSIDGSICCAVAFDLEVNKNGKTHPIKIDSNTINRTKVKMLNIAIKKQTTEKIKKVSLCADGLVDMINQFETQNGINPMAATASSTQTNHDLIDSLNHESSNLKTIQQYIENDLKPDDKNHDKKAIIDLIKQLAANSVIDNSRVDYKEVKKLFNQIVKFADEVQDLISKESTKEEAEKKLLENKLLENKKTVLAKIRIQIARWSGYIRSDQFCGKKVRIGSILDKISGYCQDVKAVDKSELLRVGSGSFSVIEQKIINENTISFDILEDLLIFLYTLIENGVKFEKFIKNAGNLLIIYMDLLMLCKSCLFDFSSSNATKDFIQVLDIPKIESSKEHYHPDMKVALCCTFELKRNDYIGISRLCCPCCTVVYDYLGLRYRGSLPTFQNNCENEWQMNIDEKPRKRFLEEFENIQKRLSWFLEAICETNWNDSIDDDISFHRFQCILEDPNARGRVNQFREEERFQFGLKCIGSSDDFSLTEHLINTQVKEKMKKLHDKLSDPLLWSKIALKDAE